MIVSYVTLEIKQASSTTIRLDKPVLLAGSVGLGPWIYKGPVAFVILAFLVLTLYGLARIRQN
jgi:hypothetical protein